MRRALYALLVGLVGAGIVHILVLLLLPSFSDSNIWSRVAVASDLYEPIRLDRPGIAGVSVGNPDPLFRIVSCRFDLADGVLRVRTDGHVPYWSASIYDRTGANIYSFNDRTSPSGGLDFAVLTPIQTIEVRKDVPEELQGSSFIESEVTEGVAVIRAFVPDETWSPTANTFLDGISCKPV